MFCPNCGKELHPADRYCPLCGRPMQPPRRSPNASGFPWKWVAVSCIALAVIAAVTLIITNASAQKKGQTQAPSDAAATESAVSQDAEPVATTAVFALPASTPIPMCDYKWVENQTVLQSKNKNFFSAIWSDRYFRVGATKYSHGVGIKMVGSEAESVKNPSSGDVWTEPYSEVYVDLPLSGQFIKLTFDIGFDSTDTNRWGDPSVNGYGRFLLLDAASDRVLYDTGIVDYTFGETFVSIDTTDVDVMRMVYQVSPVVEKQKSSLNLILGKAMLYTYGDKYTPSMAYSPVLDELPTDYSEYEPYATDEIEAFILRGYHDKYCVEELEYFSKEEMEYVLNGVYALSGKWFGRSDLWNYFTSKSWYYPVRADITDNEKNSFQQANEETIVAYMKNLGWR